jgi:hypothetical protein
MKFTSVLLSPPYLRRPDTDQPMTMTPQPGQFTAQSLLLSPSAYCGELSRECETFVVSSWILESIFSSVNQARHALLRVRTHFETSAVSEWLNLRNIPEQLGTVSLLGLCCQQFNINNFNGFSSEP